MWMTRVRPAIHGLCATVLSHLALVVKSPTREMSSVSRALLQSSGRHQRIMFVKPAHLAPCNQTGSKLHASAEMATIHLLTLD
eukprot:SAG31_NODE_40323_length_281_cov_1.120879_1_plen_82_part_01